MDRLVGKSILEADRGVVRPVGGAIGGDSEESALFRVVSEAIEESGEAQGIRTRREGLALVEVGLVVPPVLHSEIMVFGPDSAFIKSFTPYWSS